MRSNRVCIFSSWMPEETSASATYQTETSSSFTSSNFNNSTETQQPHQPSRSSSSSGDDSADRSASFEAIEMLRATARTLRTTVERLMGGIDNLSAQIDQLASSFHSGNRGSVGASAAGGGGVRDNLKRSYSDLTPLGNGDGSTTKKPNRTKSDSSGCTDCGFTGESKSWTFIGDHSLITNSS